MGPLLHIHALLAKTTDNLTMKSCHTTHFGQIQPPLKYLRSVVEL